MRILIKLLLVAILMWNVGTASGQVNTERLRRGDVKEGWHNSFTFDLGYISGNSNFLNLTGNARSDFKIGKYYTFGVVNYQRGKEAGQLFVNEGFIHVRGMRSFTPVISGEVFLQKEFDQFILLNDRNLAGGGIRMQLLSGAPQGRTGIPLRLFLGMGFMWENEVLNTSPVTETNLLRSTNYVSAAWSGNELMEFNLVSYYQVAVKQVKNYRILLQSRLAFRLSQTFSFHMNLNYRYNSEPPPGIKQYDLGLTNGIQFDF